MVYFQEPLQLQQAWEVQACRQCEPWGLLAGVSYQEPQQLLQVQGNQAFRQWEFWDLLAECDLKEEPLQLQQAWEVQACRQWEPWNLLAGMSYQEPQQLLQVQGNQVCRQREFLGLFARSQHPGATGAAAVTGEQSLWAVETQGPAYWHRLLGVQCSNCCWHRKPSLLACAFC
jgi:hypothetical protein